MKSKIRIQELLEDIMIVQGLIQYTNHPKRRIALYKLLSLLNREVDNEGV